MQRCHPALTALWLQWTGIPDLERSEFGIGRSEDGVPATAIRLGNSKRVMRTWALLADVLGAEPDAAVRRQNPLHLPKNDIGHATFWHWAKNRDSEVADSPLEWWWNLLILRRGGLKAASSVLLNQAIGDDEFFDNAIVSFQNPTLQIQGRTAAVLLPGKYSSPTSMLVTKPVSRKSRTEGLAFDLSDAKFKVRLTTSLIDLAVIRTV